MFRVLMHTPNETWNTHVYIHPIIFAPDAENMTTTTTLQQIM